MGKHTSKAVQSSRASQPSSKHSGTAMNRVRGFPGAQPRTSHSARALSSTRPAKASSTISAIREANKRRNFSGRPKAR